MLWQCLKNVSDRINLIIKITTNTFLLMPSTVINCAGDSELAGKIKDYFISKTSIQSDNSICISLLQDEVQIVPEKLGLSRDSVKSLLNSFIKSNPELAGYYSVTEFEDIFVVSIQRSLAEMVANCEMCRYIASSEGDLVIHKRTHGWIFIL
jgi:hypothetical protein